MATDDKNIDHDYAQLDDIVKSIVALKRFDSQLGLIREAIAVVLAGKTLTSIGYDTTDGGWHHHVIDHELVAEIINKYTEAGELKEKETGDE